MDKQKMKRAKDIEYLLSNLDSIDFWSRNKTLLAFSTMSFIIYVAEIKNLVASYISLFLKL
jgi:hypothetical protein